MSNFKPGDVVVGNDKMVNVKNRGRIGTVVAAGIGCSRVKWQDGDAFNVDNDRLEYKDGYPGAGLGAKFDGGKVDPGMLFQGCARALRGVLRVLEFGAKKYAADSWRSVPDGMRRYHAAFQRHKQTTDIEGLWALDPETGLYEVDHMITNLLFLRELKAAEDASNV